ncbi:MAG TPA: M23 family metallopeptidase [Gemmatimonadaceae bacterium]|nr:M23 family metallopeptidase [Gemmatimonadaceae bacterium]
MSHGKARAIAYGVVALLGVAAVLFTKPLPPRTPVAEALLAGVAAPVINPWRERHDTVRRGETIISVLARGGLSEVLAREAIKVAKSLNPRSIPAGMRVITRTPTQDTIPSEVILRLAVDRLLHLRRGDSGWVADEQRLPWVMDTVVVSGTITSTLYEAMDSAARELLPPSARQELVYTLADVYEYRVDMSRDLQVGDRFTVAAERRRLDDGMDQVTRMNQVLGASMTLSGRTTEAVRFRSATGGLFFDQDGKPMRSGFLRTPVAFRRISSGFGMRRHPILGTMRAHQGTDYAANAGTPIRAIGDGVVIRASYHNGYGNVVDIRHANGYVSRYAHMSRFGAGIRAGARVLREQNVGYVGSTGLSTAPHLHFEVLVKGVQRNPRAVLANVSADPIPANERASFAEARTLVKSLLDSPAVLASAEKAGVRQSGSQQ